MPSIYNSASRSQQNIQWGHVWKEILSNAATTGIAVPKYRAVRVRAAAPLTVKFDGELAATMASGEIIVFNSGSGDNKDTKRTVKMEISAAAYVQLASISDKDREDKIA